MIQDFKNKHKDETVVIIGNGSSLDQTPLQKLSEKYVTYGANKIFNYPFVPTYWACFDMDMLHDTIPYLMEHNNTSEKFVPRNIPLPGAHQLRVEIDGKFSTDPSDCVYLGGTVTFVNLQLAYYMGAKTVLLVGVDHDYPKRAHDGIPGSKFIAEGRDVAHFRGTSNIDYFTPGKIYNRPELDSTAKYIYPLAKKAFAERGGEVVNITPGTKLDVFRKDEIGRWLCP